MASETIGLVIDVSAKGLANLGGAARSLSNFGGAMKGVTGFITPLNQGLEVAKKAFQLFEKTIGDSIKKSLEFRSELDPARQAMEGFGGQLETTQARLGDVFIPLLVGIAQAVGPILTQFQNWLLANRALITSGIIEWTQKLAVALVSTLGAAGKVVTSVWMGLKVAIAGVLGTIAEGLSVFDSSFQDFADHQRSEIALATSDWKKQQATIESVSVAVLDVVDTAAQAGLAFQDAAQTSTKSWEARKKAAEEARKAEEAAKKASEEREKLEFNANMASLKASEQLALAKKAQWDGELEQAQDLAAAKMELSMEANQKLKEHTEELAADYERVGMSIYGSFKSAFSGVLQGTKTVGEAFAQLGMNLVNLFIDMAAQWVIGEIAKMIATDIAATSQIAANAGIAASGAAAAMAGIPLVGPALAAAAAATTFATVMGYQAAVAMAEGGLVRGGTPGRDSVPAMLMPGEYVLPTHVVDSIRAGQPPGQAGQYATGGMVSGGGSRRGGMPPVQQNFMMFTHSRAAFAKVYRDEFAPVTKRLTRNRVIKAG